MYRSLCSRLWVGPCPGNTVGARDEFDRVQGAGRNDLSVRQHFHLLHDVHPRERTFGCHEWPGVLERLTRDRPSHFQSRLEVALEYAPGTAVPGAPLDHSDVGLREQP